MKKKPKVKAIEFNPVCDLKTVHGYKNVRWTENVSRGLRLVGFADEIARKEGNWRIINHKGWFTDDDGDGNVYRGVVYQLPSHGKEGACYVYGYADPDNEDCALITYDVTADKMEAARQADRFAEIFAEHERDYQRAWRAGRDYEELADEIKESRREALKIAEEMRAAKKAHVDAPTICSVLRGKILALYRSIQKARAKRAELFVWIED